VMGEEKVVEGREYRVLNVLPPYKSVRRKH
jgi:hypothetical protein